MVYDGGDQSAALEIEALVPVALNGVGGEILYRDESDF